MFLGDFNVNFLNSQHPSYHKLQFFASSLCLAQIVTEPTHSSPTSDTLIDLIFLSAPNNLVSCTTIPALANSDHLGLLTSISTNSARACPKKSQHKVWRYSHANFESACEYLAAVDWDSLFLSGDVNISWSNRKAKFCRSCLNASPSPH